jgi:uncharacterized protein YndB with AHSA1/START domain
MTEPTTERTAEPPAPDFVYVTHIATTRDRLWAALTGPDFTRRYWNGRILDSDWQVGSAISFRHDYDDQVDSTGTVLAVDPPRRLRYGMTGADGQESTVTFELTAHGDVVELTVTQTGLIPGSTAYRMVSGGWSFILSNLKTLLETGDVLPMPASVLAAYR